MFLNAGNLPVCCFLSIESIEQQYGKNRIPQYRYPCGRVPVLWNSLSFFYRWYSLYFLFNASGSSFNSRKRSPSPAGKRSKLGCKRHLQPHNLLPHRILHKNPIGVMVGPEAGKVFPGSQNPLGMLVQDSAFEMGQGLFQNLLPALPGSNL